MKPNIEELRKKYMDNPPEGMTSKDIRNMSEDELLDMDYFLNEDDLFADEAGVEGFFSFKSSIKIELSYKVKKVRFYVLFSFYFIDFQQYYR